MKTFRLTFDTMYGKAYFDVVAENDSAAHCISEVIIGHSFDTVLDADINEVGIIGDKKP